MKNANIHGKIRNMSHFHQSPRMGVMCSPSSYSCSSSYVPEKRYPVLFMIGIVRQVGIRVDGRSVVDEREMTNKPVRLLEEDIEKLGFVE